MTAQPCPTPTKAPFTKAEAATEAARGRCDRRVPSLGAYACVCGAWHLSRGGNLNARIRGALKKETL